MIIKLKTGSLHLPAWTGKNYEVARSKFTDF